MKQKEIFDTKIHKHFASLSCGVTKISGSQVSEKKVHQCLKPGAHLCEENNVNISHHCAYVDDKKQSKQWTLQLRRICDAHQSEITHHCEILLLLPALSENLF
jgi:hypothetical protein